MSGKVIGVSETMIFGICVAVALLGLAGAVILAAMGKDLIYFERLRIVAPRQFKSLVLTCRFNGIMTAALSLGGVIASCVLPFTGEPFARLISIGVFLGSAAVLWLSVRWLLWAWQIRL